LIAGKKVKRATRSAGRVVQQLQSVEAKGGATRRTPAPTAAGRNETEQIAVRVPAGFARRVRSAVRFTPDLTITELVVRAVGAEIDRIEHKRREPFPTGGGPVRRGRPVRRD